MSTLNNIIGKSDYNGIRAVDFGIFEEYQVERLDEQIHVRYLRNPLNGRGGGK